MRECELVLITGAAGGVGSLLWPRLAGPGRVLRLFDIAGVPAARGVPGVEVAVGSITDPDALLAACQGVQAVIHLAGVPTEADWASIVETNIGGTRHLLEAARLAGVRRVVLASSTHVAGFHAVDRSTELPAQCQPRPDTYYGLSKVAMEALGSLYHDRFGLNVLCLRIGTWCEKPTGPRHLSTWLSPGDGARLIEACLSVRDPGFRVVWGISRNTRRWLSLAEGQAIGYQPVDDAERYAHLICGASDRSPDGRPLLLGNDFCTMPLGRPKV